MIKPMPRPSRLTLPPTQSIKKPSKTPAQVAAERSRKRRQTLVRKAFTMAKDCGSNVFMIIQDAEGTFYKYQTIHSADWPPAGVVSKSVKDPAVVIDADKMMAGKNIPILVHRPPVFNSDL